MLAQSAYIAIKHIFLLARELAEADSRVTILDRDMYSVCKIFLHKYDPDNEDDILEEIDNKLDKFVNLKNRTKKKGEKAKGTISSRIGIIFPTSRVEAHARRVCGGKCHIPKTTVVLTTACVEEFIKNNIYSAAYKRLEQENTTDLSKNYQRGRVRDYKKWKAKKEKWTFSVANVLAGLGGFANKQEIVDFVTFNRGTSLYNAKKRKLNKVENVEKKVKENGGGARTVTVDA